MAKCEDGEEIVKEGGIGVIIAGGVLDVLQESRVAELRR